MVSFFSGDDFLNDDHVIPGRESPYVSDYYVERYSQWRKNRDVVAGENVVKRAGDTYLIPFSSQQTGDTERDREVKREYLRRAVFVPYAQKFVYGVSGALTRHNPLVTIEGFRKIRNLTEVEFLGTLLPDGMNLVDCILMSLQEMMKTGEVGFWVNDGKVYLYSAENILNQKEDYVLLKETIEPSRKISDVARRQKKNKGTSFVDGRDGYVIRYRELTLRNGNFVVRTYDENFKRTYSTYPKIRGKKLNYIPFYSVKSRTDLPMVSDMVGLNLNHYNLSALIAQAQRFSSFPIYAVPIPRGTQAKTPKYHISPFRVWEYSADTKGPSVLEFYGQSLQTLQASLKDIEHNIAASGARIVGIGSGRDVDADVTVFHALQKMEQSVLMHVCRVLEETLEKAFEEAITQKFPAQRPNVTIRIQKSELIMSPIGDRMLRALGSLVKDSQMPPGNLYDVLQIQGFIPSDMSFEDFNDYVSEKTEEKQQVDIDLVKAQIKKLERDSSGIPKQKSENPAETTENLR